MHFRIATSILNFWQELYDFVLMRLKVIISQEASTAALQSSFHLHHSVIYLLAFCGSAVASWLVRSTPERVLRVRALAGDIVLCSWARHFTLMVPLSTQVYKWVPANLMLWVTLRWTSILSREE